MHTETQIPSQEATAKENLVVGIFSSQDKATQLVEKLIHDDFPADQISILNKSGGSGDDILGVTYSNHHERMKVWGEHGAF